MAHPAPGHSTVFPTLSTETLNVQYRDVEQYIQYLMAYTLHVNVVGFGALHPVEPAIGDTIVRDKWIFLM